MKNIPAVTLSGRRRVVCLNLSSSILSWVYHRLPFGYRVVLPPLTSKEKHHV